MAMIYALWKNFHDLEDPYGAQQILIWGSFFMIALLAFAPLYAASVIYFTASVEPLPSQALLSLASLFVASFLYWLLAVVLVCSISARHAMCVW